MRHLKNILYLFAAGILISSCSNYSAISDNDVYLQKPAAIDLAEGGEDITSYNAYKAGRDGLYESADNRMRYGTSFSMGFGSPMMYPYSFSPYYGYSDPFWGSRNYWGSPYYGNGMYMGSMYGYGYGYGNNFGMYPGYGYYGHGMHGYYGSAFTGVATNSSSIQSVNNSYFNKGSQNQHYTKRSTLTSSSNRSSSYPNTLKSKSITPAGGVSVNDQTAGTSRRNIANRRSVYGSEYVKPKNSHGTSQSASYRNNTNVTRGNVAAESRRTGNYTSGTSSNRSYTPSNSARRSGAVTRSTTPRATPNYSSGSNRSPQINSGTTQGSSTRGATYSSPSRSSGGSMNRSGGSSGTRSSSGSSSSGRR